MTASIYDFTPATVRGGILALLAKNEGRWLNYDEIWNALKNVVSRKSISRQVCQLERAGFVKRWWDWNMASPRFTLSDKAEEIVRGMLLGIIEGAGKDGIIEADGESELIRRVYDYGSRTMLVHL